MKKFMRSLSKKETYKVDEKKETIPVGDLNKLIEFDLQHIDEQIKNTKNSTNDDQFWNDNVLSAIVHAADAKCGSVCETSDNGKKCPKQCVGHDARMFSQGAKMAAAKIATDDKGLTEAGNKAYSLYKQHLDNILSVSIGGSPGYMVCSDKDKCPSPACDDNNGNGYCFKLPELSEYTGNNARVPGQSQLPFLTTSTYNRNERNTDDGKGNTSSSLSTSSSSTYNSSSSSHNYSGGSSSSTLINGTGGGGENTDTNPEDNPSNTTQTTKLSSSDKLLIWGIFIIIFFFAAAGIVMKIMIIRRNPAAGAAVLAVDTLGKAATSIWGQTTV